MTILYIKINHKKVSLPYSLVTFCVEQLLKEDGIELHIQQLHWAKGWVP